MLGLEKEAVSLFKVIEGGLYGAAALYAGADQVSKLRVEGQRRLQQADLEGFEARERVTGIAIPSSVGFFKLQIGFAIHFSVAVVATTGPIIGPTTIGRRASTGLPSPEKPLGIRRF